MSTCMNVPVCGWDTLRTGSRPLILCRQRTQSGSEDEGTQKLVGSGDKCNFHWDHILGKIVEEYSPSLSRRGNILQTSVFLGSGSRDYLIFPPFCVEETGRVQGFRFYRDPRVPDIHWTLDVWDPVRRRGSRSSSIYYVSVVLPHLKSQLWSD